MLYYPYFLPVIDIARHAGSVIMESYATNVEVFTKQDHSPVTVADRAANSLIVKKLHELTNELGLKEKVIFTGFVDDNEVWTLFNICEMSIYNYSPMSGSTHALGFAIQHNKPVILSDLEIFKEVLGEGALFVEPDNVTQLENAILELSNNPNLQEKLCTDYEAIKNKFSWNKAASHHLKLYDELIRS